VLAPDWQGVGQKDSTKSNHADNQSFDMTTKRMKKKRLGLFFSHPFFSSTTGPSGQLTHTNAKGKED
jgi:hypothetical protein